jgi:hypothetical protein
MQPKLLEAEKQALK